MNQKKYNVEFTMHIYDTPLDILQNSLKELGDSLNLEEERAQGKERIIKINIQTDDPHLVFDTCSQFGRLKSVKIDEGRR